MYCVICPVVPNTLFGVFKTALWSKTIFSLGFMGMVISCVPSRSWHQSLHFFHTWRSKRLLFLRRNFSLKLCFAIEAIFVEQYSHKCFQSKTCRIGIESLSCEARETARTVRNGNVHNFETLWCQQTVSLQFYWNMVSCSFLTLPLCDSCCKYAGCFKMFRAVHRFLVFENVQIA